MHDVKLDDEIFNPKNHYKPTLHLADRYRERMIENSSKVVAKHIMNATDEEIGHRANYMLLFSIYGRPGETPNTEVRYYFNWEIIIDTKKKTIITLYEDKKKRPLPAHLFGDSKQRKAIYKLWFLKKFETNSKDEDEKSSF
ncbi:MULTISPECIES: hypothetical protein [unclassified Solibacillus]|uniref:hypothetical protein n=1 Tax=unclassified Solibacillus TaxID=2637870 RepID=UPI0030F9B770